MAIDPRNLLKRKPAAEPVPAPVPLGGTRAERMQRVQIGLFGLLTMVLLVALADIVITRARQTEAAAVPEAAATVVASETAAPSDPLADAGVVPELPEATPPPAGAQDAPPAAEN